MNTVNLQKLRQTIRDLQTLEVAMAASIEKPNIPTPPGLAGAVDDSKVWTVTPGNAIIVARLVFANILEKDTDAQFMAFPRIDTLQQDITKDPADFLQQCAAAITSRNTEGYVLEDLDIHVITEASTLGVKDREPG